MELLLLKQLGTKMWQERSCPLHVKKQQSGCPFPPVGLFKMCLHHNAGRYGRPHLCSSERGRVYERVQCFTQTHLSPKTCRLLLAATCCTCVCSFLMAPFWAGKGKRKKQNPFLEASIPEKNGRANHMCTRVSSPKVFTQAACPISIKQKWACLNLHKKAGYPQNKDTQMALPYGHGH